MSNSIVIQFPDVNEFNVNSASISPRSNILLNTPKTPELCYQRFNTPCSEDIFTRYKGLAIERAVKLDEKRQQNLLIHQTTAEIGVALGLWRKIHKLHQHIENIHKTHEKQNHVHELRLCHTQRNWENFLKRGKRIADLQKQRSIEKIQLDRRKMERIKAHNELIEKLKSNREQMKYLANIHKEVRKMYQLTQDHINYEKRLLNRKKYTEEKFQQLLNLQNYTNEIRYGLNKSVETVKQHQNQLVETVRWNQICDKFNIETSIQERRAKEIKSINEHTKQLRKQKIIKIPISMKPNNLTLNIFQH
ncbi:unnamed protein product [Heterobilharzia americana]|nr:unnamed protein product [Heterobilharzia americana]